MGDDRPDLRMMNLIVRDMGAAVEFYRRLGVTVPEGDAATGVHVQLRMPSGFSLELDTAESLAWWHAGWRADPGSVAVVVCFALRQSGGGRRARTRTLTAAGYAGRQPPFDAFWGARCAIVADPDGNDVGLMSPMDDAPAVVAADPSHPTRDPARRSASRQPTDLAAGATENPGVGCSCIVRTSASAAAVMPAPTT